MLMLILLLVAAVFLFYYFMVKPLDYWKDRGVKQGNPMWIAGDNWGILSRTESSVKMLQRVYNQCPDVRYSGMYQFLVPALVVKDPDLIKQITVKDFDHFTDHKSIFPETAEPLWGKNLIFLKGQKWRDMRTILSPSFTTSKIKTMFFLISECAENFVQHFLKKKEDVVTVEFKDIFTRFTNDVIASTAFGIQVDSLAQPNNTFYLLGKEATNLDSFKNIFKFFAYFVFPRISNFLKIQLFSNEVRASFQKIVKDTIKMREEKNIVRQDMTNLLLEAKKGVQKQEENDVIDTGLPTAKESDLMKSTKPPTEITDVDIAAQAMIFFFAGFESVSTLMCFLAYELAANPDIQDRLREEIRSALEKCEGKLTYEDILEMKYMDMVVSEALRKWPSTIATDRVCTKPYTIEPTTPGEVPLYLEKGTLIMLPIYSIHHDPKYFPNPERFDPERFSDENKGDIKPYTYFPFGVGPRNCIGSRFALLETKIVIFHILKNFELVPVEKSRIPLQICRKRFNMTAEGGLWFGLKRISE
ncbi:cytochrome P450 9e2-like [Anoplophora glabripennis]|uniref:cytochrome P450 9e2-like n=1 Tax=Anoplophora glabripennis TaxID=217634 RepID=UPI000874C285|nr:cytochrome P450 9e2-like [Anoplophora glabripennis]XP_018570838.1 cytochrome P450 9e2-like [Anoplophora glabripennis]